jgi:L,D-transpeptidase ErfK/SrfK
MGSAATYTLTEGAPPVLGENQKVTTVYEDTLIEMARRYGLGYEELGRVNPGVDPWLPGANKEITIPLQRILPSGPREGIVINLPEHRLYYYPKPKKGQPQTVITYPVSIGKMDWQTPMGETKIVSKKAMPSWRPPESVRKEHAERGDPLPEIVPPGPDNPLGEYAMRLDITSGSYLIHGTNNPLAVGMAVTHGCIRMYPEDIAALFPLVKTGTKVRLINEPIKVAYVNGELLLEVHPPVTAQGETAPVDVDYFAHLLVDALGENTAAIHWDFALQALQAAQGVPTLVGLEAELDPPVMEPPTPGAPAVDTTPIPPAAVPAAPTEVAPTQSAAGQPLVEAPPEPTLPSPTTAATDTAARIGEPHN